MSSKVEEALAHIKEAEKSLKTGLLKWNPDYDVAADEYKAAATCYKGAHKYKESRECLLKAAENYRTIKSTFTAAKCIEQAALISKETGEMDAVSHFTEKAAVLYREHGVPDTAALVLTKGAKIVENEKPEKALSMYIMAVDTVMCEDRPRNAAEYQSKVCRILVKLQKFTEAYDAVLKEISFYQMVDNNAAIGRLCVALVLIQIARGDNIAAEKAFRSWGGYCEQDEVNTLEQILKGLEEEDGDMARRGLNAPFLKHMDVEYAKLARELAQTKCPASNKASSSGTTGSVSMGGASASGGGATQEAAGGDDDEMDLC